MSISEQLRKFGLLDWSMLLLGFERGYISKEDIENHALFLLSNNSDKLDVNVAVLASARSYSDSEVKNIILTQYNPEKILLKNQIEKLQLAALLDLKEASISDDEKCDKLQELYADFDYPENMSECSIYSQSSVSPIQAMNEVITQLQQKYTDCGVEKRAILGDHSKVGTRN